MLLFVILVDYLQVKNYNDIECKSLFSLEERIKTTDNKTKTTLTYYLEDGSVDEIRHYEDPIEEESFDSWIQADNATSFKSKFVNCLNFCKGVIYPNLFLGLEFKMF